jgi:hypothetical protein
MSLVAPRIKHINVFEGNWAGPDFLIQRQRDFNDRPWHEVDLRKELQELLYGDGVSAGKGFTVIHRQVVKNQRGRAWNRAGGSFDEAQSNDATVSRYEWPKRDVLRTCMKHKFIGTEIESPVGQLDYESAKFYFEWTANFDKEDELIEIQVNDLGKPVTPVKYIKRHSIKDIEVYHGLNGRVEYQRVIVTKAE